MFRVWVWGLVYRVWGKVRGHSMICHKVTEICGKDCGLLAFGLKTSTADHAWSLGLQVQTIDSKL